MDKLYKEYCKSYRLTQDNAEDFFETVKDVLFTPEIQSLKQYEQHLEIDRLQHITSVTYLSYLLCRKFGLNYRSASKSAVMHDLVYYDWRDGDTGKWHKLHGYRHPALAVRNALELCEGNLSKLETDIIRKHMWPLTVIPPRYLEGFIVSFSDKYCATREVMYSTSQKYKAKFLRDVEEIV